MPYHISNGRKVREERERYPTVMAKKALPLSGRLVPPAASSASIVALGIIYGYLADSPTTPISPPISATMCEQKPISPAMGTGTSGNGKSHSSAAAPDFLLSVPNHVSS